MVVFLIILGISAKLNIDIQDNLRKTLLIQDLNYKIDDSIFNLFKKYELLTKNKEELFAIINSESFQKEFKNMNLNGANACFIMTNDSNGDYKRKVISYTFGKGELNDYIMVQKDQSEALISIKDIPLEIKNQFIEELRRSLNDTKGDNTLIDIEYCLDHQNLSYLHCGNITYGSKTDKVQKGFIADFCINQQKMISRNDMYYEFADEFVLDTKELHNIALNQNIFTGSGSTAVYVHTDQNHKNRVCVCLTTSLGVNEDVTVIFEKIYSGIHDISINEFLKENSLLFAWAFVIVVLLSWIVSYMISYPIKRIGKAALNIAHQDFDEEVNIKSKDEIGQLAQNIDFMRKQLKDTIRELETQIDKVKKLESLRKEFINQFTHEMKTPLGIINGYSELLEETEDEALKEHYLEVINRETVHINQLIQSMLKLSRLEAGKVELHEKEFDLEDSVVEIIDEYEVLFMKKKIHVDVHVEQSMIKGDPELLKTVIHNFLSNAIKHVHYQGKIIIFINKGISIYNEGPLIEEDRLEKIWYSFVTGDQDGNGIGLAICQSILELHHYHFGVNNKESGVEFYFYEK